MTHLNKSIATKLAAKLEAYDASLDTQESQLAELLRFTKQHKVDREHVYYAITCFVSHKYNVAMNDKGQLVKACDNHKNASKRRERLMHSIYGEPKPKANNKVDRQTRINAAEKRLVDSFSTAELRQLVKQLQARMH